MVNLTSERYHYTAERKIIAPPQKKQSKNNCNQYVQRGLDSSRQRYFQTQHDTFQKHVSTETSVIFSLKQYKVQS